MQIYPEVTTQKIVLVGHSQGTFYTNEIYEYLIHHGVSPQSVAVYNLATPANRVAGNGAYLTSTNDKVIEYVRELDAQVGAPQPLATNIIIPREPGWQFDGWGGHSLTGAYLRGAPDRIVSDIGKALGNLSANTSDIPRCFTPPTQTIGYHAQTAFFAALDPAAAVAVPAIEKTGSGIALVLSSTRDGIAEVTNALNVAIGKTFYFIFPKPDAQSATAAFSVAKTLYGSSLSEAQYKALLTGNDLPENPASPAPQENVTAAPQKPAVQEQPTNTAPTPPAPSPGDQRPVPQQSVPPPAPPTQRPGNGMPEFGVGGGVPMQGNVAMIASSNTSMHTPSAPSAAAPAAATSTESKDPQPPQTASSTPQAAFSTPLFLAITSPDDNASFSTSTIGFTGTTSPTATVFAHFGTTTTSVQADAAGNWALALTLDAGTTTVSLSALDAAGATSSTSTRTVSIALQRQEPKQPSLSPTAHTPCARPALIAEGYFFSHEKDEAGYDAQGHLEYHVALLPYYQTGRTFKLSWNFYDDECNSMGPTYEHPSLSIALPSGDTDWSVRFTSPTHFDVWDDDSARVIAGADIPQLPSYASIAFSAMIDDYASVLASRGVRISQSGSVPIVEGSIAAAAGCTAENKSYLIDGSYERAEYVGGLLRLHLRIQAPYNGGRFYALALGGSDCAALHGVWWKDIHASASIPAYERYFSLRMASSTHWQLWDDEQNTPLGAEGDIPDKSAYVRFYSVLDVDQSYLSGAYAPAQ